jgi:hypothetical protein
MVDRSEIETRVVAAADRSARRERERESKEKGKKEKENE